MSQNKCVREFWKSIGTGSQYTKKGRVKERVCKTSRDEVFSHKDKVTFKLHGCSIVKADKRKRLLKLDSCGWKTKTTKTRLNELLREAGVGEQISQKKGVWYLNGNKYEDGMRIKY